ncbi:amidase [Roseibium aquae]|uniref:Amidase n=1 Tax=Roseibium aquae TaxID=1323746 RepID=A0A916T6P9_9HYPH|nr:amidase family protein [Roseibium aquae]GGB34003.1 amidase [Roseibium aquae]
MASQNFPWSAQTARQRAVDAFDRLQSRPAEHAAIYTKAFDPADQDLHGDPAHPLSGALISVKALFDVKGEVTTAGADVLRACEPAQEDAPAIANLRAAGAVFTGLTNMSEFAYSGLGLNPHFGTPENAVFPGCAPGGSTSGGAVSVARGLADIAIGSDTGGSLRIPAAFNGLVGFKPTQASVSLQGGCPLSDTLDSFGPMSRSVAACELAWQVMAGRDVLPVKPRLSRFIVPENFGFNEMDPAIRKGFERVVRSLQSGGADIERRKLACIEPYDQIPPWHFTSVESRAHYENFFVNQASHMDPRVHARMGRADEISAVTYRQSLNRRKAFVKVFAEELGDALLLLPTTPILPPALARLEDDAVFNSLNLLALRNPSLANIADGCSIALPFVDGGLVLSAMLIGPNGHDHQLLACAKHIEPLLADMT